MENKGTEITIIIPHFNTPDYLRKLLDSIPCLDTVQVLVIDDKSTAEKERYISLVNSEKYHYITFIDNTTDKKGAGVCRNIGIEHSEGEWILFADSDDYFVTDLYSKIMKYLDSDLDVIFFPLISIDMETKTESHRHVEINRVLNDYFSLPNQKNELNIRYHMPVPYSKLIKSKLIKKNRIIFDDTLVANDVMFSTKVGFYMSTFNIATDNIYCVTNNTGSLTKVMSEENYNTRLNVFIEKYNFLKIRLSEDDFKLLNLNGKLFIRWVFQYRLGIRKLIWLLRYLFKNDVKIVGNVKEINPREVVRRLKKVQRWHKEDRKHLRFK